MLLKTDEDLADSARRPKPYHYPYLFPYKTVSSKGAGQPGGFLRPKSFDGAPTINGLSSRFTLFITHEISVT